MATNNIPADAAPQQPGLRPFIVYNELPLGLAAYPVMDDKNDPLLRLGEMVIVDPHDCEPSEHELFLIQWDSDPTPRVVETWMMPKLNCWCVGYVKQPGWVEGMGRWCDWGYKTEALSARLLGRVVGILEPVFAEQTRVLA